VNLGHWLRALLLVKMTGDQILMAEARFVTVTYVATEIEGSKYPCSLVRLLSEVPTP
jgi:hypothetical protein